MCESVQARMARKGRMSPPRAQVVSGHGGFGNHLVRIGKAVAGLCPDCSILDDPIHRLTACPSFQEARNQLNTHVHFDPPTTFVERSGAQLRSPTKSEHSLLQTVRTRYSALRLLLQNKLLPSPQYFGQDFPLWINTYAKEHFRPGFPEGLTPVSESV